MYYSAWMSVIFFSAMWHVHWLKAWQSTCGERCLTTEWFVVIKEKKHLITFTPSPCTPPPQTRLGRKQWMCIIQINKSGSYSHPKTQKSLMASFFFYTVCQHWWDLIFMFKRPHTSAHSVTNSLILPHRPFAPPNVPLFPPSDSDT